MEGALARQGEVTEEDIREVGVYEGLRSVVERKDSKSVIIVRSFWRRWWVAGCCSCRSDRVEKKR